jgi:hypothetical protein
MVCPETMSGVYDNALLRFHRTGPEFDGWLSNHGPMAVDALVRMDRAEVVDGWVDKYVRRLEELPSGRWSIEVEEWPDLLGDASRLGDWLVFFERQLAGAPWREVLSTWWPRLMPGAIASATHGLIRTGHAVRALMEETTEPRVAELGQALGYWASRWAPLPAGHPRGRLSPALALSGLPFITDHGDAASRVAAIFEEPRWVEAAERVAAPAGPQQVETALDQLVDVAVARYQQWAPSQPIMLVHMATAPRAARLCLPALPTQLWPLTYAAAWNVSAAIGSMYRPAAAAELDPVSPPTSRDDVTAGDVAAQAAAHGDEHVIKFSEVAIESYERGNPGALGTARTAMRLIQ